MREHFKFGDMVMVTNCGQTYDTFIDMAEQLRADIHPKQLGTFDVLRGYKWTYGGVPKEGDIFSVANISNDLQYILIENDNHQFIIGPKGIKILEDILPEELFEL